MVTEAQGVDLPKVTVLGSNGDRKPTVPQWSALNKWDSIFPIVSVSVYRALAPCQAACSAPHVHALL